MPVLIAAVVIAIALPISSLILDRLTRNPKPHRGFDALSRFPERLEFSRGGGSTGLILSALGAAGAIAIVAGLPNGIWPIILIGGIVLLLGIAGAGGRFTISLDCARGHALKATSFFQVPIRSSSIPLATAKHVTYEKRVLSNRSAGDTRSANSTVSYPVHLVHAEGGLELYDLGNPYDARELGEIVAKFLQLDLHDKTGDSTEIRACAELDLSLGDKIRAAGEMPDLPQPPPRCRITSEADGDAVILTLPPDADSVWVTTRITQRSIEFTFEVKGGNRSEISFTPGEIEAINFTEPKDTPEEFEAKLESQMGAMATPERVRMMVGRYREEYEDYLHHKFSNQPLVLITDSRSIALGSGLTFLEADWLRRYLHYALAQYSEG